MRVIIETEPFRTVQTTQIIGWVGCAIEFGGVLQDQNNRPIGDAFLGGSEMRIENIFRRNLRIVKEPIGGLSFRPAVAGCVDTRLCF